MKLREIFRYEVEHRLHSGSTWAYAILLFLITIWMFLATTDGAGPTAHANAPERLAGAAILPAMFGLLITAALFGGAAVRDVATGMDSLVYTFPIKKSDYLGGRFLGTLVVNAAILLVIPLGGLAATWLTLLWEPEVVGPFRAAAHIQPYFLFLLPNLILAGAILFAVGMLARQMVPVYLAAIGVFIGYVVALNYADQIESVMLAALIDPLGLVTLQGVTRYWTEVERNTRLIGLPMMLLWNRVFWLSVAVIALALLHRVLQFAHFDGNERSRKGPRTGFAPATGQTRVMDVPRVAGSFGFRTSVRQILAVTRNSLAEIMSSKWFVAVLLACVGLPLLWGWNVGDTVFDTSTLPVTLLVTEEVLAGRSPLLFFVLILVFAGELLGKDQAVGVAEIKDAAPLPDGTVLLGQFLALFAMILMFQAASLIGGILIQALQGYYNFELGLYLRVVFGLLLADYLLLAALAVTIHVLVNHKNLGHMLVVMTLGFIALGLPLLGIDHHLLRYGTLPDWTYSDMNGFGPFAAPIIWFTFYWSAWALLLLVLAVLFRVRGLEHGLRRRVNQARGRFTGPVAYTAGGAIMLILIIGGFIFYNTNVLNDYRTADSRGLIQAEYEKRYGQYQNTPQPTITSVELNVELYPHESAVDLRGSFLLENQTDGAIDTLHVVLRSDLEVRSLSLDREAEAVLVDEETGYRIYSLEQALQPGDHMHLDFDVASRTRGFQNSGIPTDVVANGSSFNRMLMPLIGYQTLLELSVDEARERFGLPPQPSMPEPEAAAGMEHRWQARDADLVHVDATIGTSAGQIAITPGRLHRSWTENGRSYFHYKTETPIAFGGSVWSAQYQVIEDLWSSPESSPAQTVALRIFHHQSHEANLDRMMRGMKASLDYLTEQFGPYPYSDLRIVEIPRYEGFGSAHPHTVAFTEDVFFSRVREGQVDQPFYGTAHEVAHAWWGGMVRGAPVRGAGFLSESLANYSAMLITEKTYGQDAGRQVYDFQMGRYLRGRATQSREVPLLEVEDQPYIAYRKGAIALYTLREHIGEEAVNGALRRYFEKYSEAGAPYPSSLDLYAELRAVTPGSLQSLLTDWFETITLWDISTERAVVEPTDTGEYLVTLDIAARKLRADGEGNETEAAMNDLVEIGVFAAGQGNTLGEPLYLQRHRISSGEQTIQITVPRAPAQAGIDPWRKLIDRQRDDNLLLIQAADGERRH